MKPGLRSYKLDHPPKYEYVPTGLGVWKTFQFENGVKFSQFTSHAEMGGLPLFSVAVGFDPETGKRATAHGVFAVGQKARGVVAVGQFASGYLAIGQFVTARVGGIGQFCAAPLAIGQFSIAAAAICQIGLVGTGIMQMGIAAFGGIGLQVLDLAKLLA